MGKTLLHTLKAQISPISVNKESKHSDSKSNQSTNDGKNDGGRFFCDVGKINVRKGEHKFSKHKIDNDNLACLKSLLVCLVI